MPRQVKRSTVKRKRAPAKQAPKKKTENAWVTKGKATPPRINVKPDMKKPKNPENIPSIVRWIERHHDRFDSEYEALKHFQEKVCAHEKETEIGRVTLPGGRVKQTLSCNECRRVRYV